MKHITSTEIDKMILFFTKQPPGEFSLAPRQAEIVKAGWTALHWYDTQHTYTFNEKFNKIRKDKL
jgi:hypothetical protein